MRPAYGRFVDLVAQCRKKPPEAICATEAAVYRGDQAVAAGLADKVGTLRVALVDLGAVLARPTVSRPIAARKEVPMSEPQGEVPIMATVSQPPAQANADLEQRLRAEYSEISAISAQAARLDTRALGFWLKGLFGAPATSGDADTGFTHVFTSGLDLPSLALEIGHAKLATPKFFRHAGAKLDKLSFDMARSGAANATISVIAQGETEIATSIDANPASFPLKRFSQGSGTIRVGGGQLANVVGGKLSFSNNLERVETMPRGLYYANDGGALDSRTVQWRVDARLVDENGDPLAEWSVLGNESQGSC